MSFAVPTDGPWHGLVRHKTTFSGGGTKIRTAPRLRGTVRRSHPGEAQTWGSAVSRPPAGGSSARQGPAHAPHREHPVRLHECVPFPPRSRGVHPCSALVGGLGGDSTTFWRLAVAGSSVGTRTCPNAPKIAWFPSGTTPPRCSAIRSNPSGCRPAQVEPAPQTALL